MIQTIIVGVIFLIAIIFTIRKVTRMIKGKDKGCNCCNGQCCCQNNEKCKNYKYRIIKKRAVLHSRLAFKY